MCTVIIEIPARAGDAVRMLAVRDEDPQRLWDPLGVWWPDAYPGVCGIRDRLAGGAWLAYANDSGRVSVILNRAENTHPAVPAVSRARVSGSRSSRGAVVLDDVSGVALASEFTTAEFNLVTASAAGAQVTSWDGERVQTQVLSPGVHMVAHHSVDDPRTARIAVWLPRFQALAGLPDNEWRQAWLDLLQETTGCQSTDDRAIIRDNRPHGYPTLSLLVCLAELHGADTTVTMQTLSTPGQFPAERVFRP